MSRPRRRWSAPAIRSESRTPAVRFGHDRKRRFSIDQALDTASAAKLRVTEPCEAADALAQRKLEGRNRGKLVAQAQLLQGLVPSGVGDVPPLAKTVPKPAGRGCGLRNRTSLHGSLCNELLT